MDAKHTPAPWVFSSPLASHLASGNYTTFIDVPQPNGMPEEEWRANRSLIAAAPELLEALKRIREIGGFSGLDHLDSVAALIAKAEGRAK